MSEPSELRARPDWGAATAVPVDRAAAIIIPSAARAASQEHPHAVARVALAGKVAITVPIPERTAWRPSAARPSESAERGAILATLVVRALMELPAQTAPTERPELQSESLPQVFTFPLRQEMVRMELSGMAAEAEAEAADKVVPFVTMARATAVEVVEAAAVAGRLAVVARAAEVQLEF